MRLIDADALINDLEYAIAIDEDILAYVGTDQTTRTTTRFDKDCKQNAIDLLMNAPSIDIEPKRGEWIEQEGCWQCSECGDEYVLEVDVKPIDAKMYYCPNCGAKMKGADDEYR